MAVNLGVIVYVVLQLIAFVCVMIGTGVDMFYIKPESSGGRRVCITLWGGKIDCRKAQITNTGNKLWALCPRIRDNFRVAQAFAIISIFVYGASLLFGCLLLYCCTGFRWLCLALNIVGAVTACVVWALMVVTYRLKVQRCDVLSGDFVFGTGFGLYVFAWVLDILNIISLMLPWQLGQSGEEAEEHAAVTKAAEQ
ncbi:putative amastin-like protein [Leishmania mexicana MHOM/GT/2001/U1103]|uniref:Amastin-like protein n=1 Tax=Leishmania mexicana (strain MHOM/GT/2001/U1103) TaxID=929439 RepID=E9AMF2_LEIMU|nr:putative amastin-like protein [Leishmania mexicana MHOM/GT/2001/U1103]CBZ24107.1 putative amastin-like protein [Leishmania mexicana MHOM/GT/2001/U1103]